MMAAILFIALPYFWSLDGLRHYYVRGGRDASQFGDRDAMKVISRDGLTLRSAPVNLPYLLQYTAF
jgi:hypothetical protein